MWFGVVTLFPEMFDAITKYGVTGRAVSQGLVKVESWNPRDFSHNRHQTVDDRPYGGGPGMVMQPGPLVESVEAAQASIQGGHTAKVLYLSPQGRPLTQGVVNELACHRHLILVSGRYEGVDERFIEHCVDEEVSLGDFVLSGGELATMALMDAIIRLQPGVLGHDQSAEQDSFMHGLLDCPHYTRPDEFLGSNVPRVLLGGNHEAIRRWRLKQALGRTWIRRPDLLAELTLDEEQQQLIEEFIQEIRPIPSSKE